MSTEKTREKKGKGRQSVWTDELIQQLLQLWQEGVSASEIARQLGHGLSRNAVIGKIHRLRKSGKAPARRDEPQQATDRQQREKPEQGSASNRGAAAAAASANRASVARQAQAVAVQMEAAPAPAPQARQSLTVAHEETGLVKDIMDLGHRSCRWPIGTPGEEGFAYCGRRAEDGGPYCQHHAEIAYTSHHKRAAG